MAHPTADSGIAVLGAGSWGTALAVLIARNGYNSFLWGRDAARMKHMAQTRTNSLYLSGIPFPEGMHLRDDLAALVQQCRYFLIAVPSEAFRATLEVLASSVAPDAIVAIATKGLEHGSGRLLSEVCTRVLGVGRRFGAISGPTFAREVARGQPTAVTVAACDPDTAETIATWLRNDHLRVYTSQDLVGVQVGGPSRTSWPSPPGSAMAWDSAQMPVLR